MAVHPRLAEWIDRFLVPIDDPGSRLFHLNLVMTLVFIGAWVAWKGGSGELRSILSETRQLVFRKRYWWNRSTRVDYQVYFLNSVLKVLLFVPFLECSYRISQWVLKPLLHWNDGELMGLAPSWGLVALFTVFAFVWDDFLRFAHHYLMHRMPALWKLHQVHHSARILTPVTLYRTHPLESAMATVRNSLSAGVATGLFIFLFGSRFTPVTVFGINLFGFAFNLLGSNLRHSHIPMSFGWLERVFISPKQHQIHHSNHPDHFDRNFGVSLSIWDRLAGTLVYSSQVRAKKLTFGLGSISSAPLSSAPAPVLSP